MTLDVTNPAVPPAPPPAETESLLQWRLKTVELQAKQANAVELMATTTANTPATEGGIYISFLCAVLNGRLAGSSGDAQIWAADLTKDYLAKYNLTGTPRGQVPPQ